MDRAEVGPIHQGGAEPELAEQRRESQEDGDHADEAEVLRHEQAGEDDGQRELDHLLDHAGGGAPGDPSDGALLQGHDELPASAVSTMRGWE